MSTRTRPRRGRGGGGVGAGASPSFSCRPRLRRRNRPPVHLRRLSAAVLLLSIGLPPLLLFADVARAQEGITITIETVQPEEDEGGTSTTTEAETATTTTTTDKPPTITVTYDDAVQQSEGEGDGEGGDATNTNTNTTNSTQEEAFPPPQDTGGGGTGQYPTVDETPPISPRAPHISLEDFVKYLDSEVKQEFDWGSTDEARARAEQHWNDVIQFEWGRCLREEIAWDNRCPFVVCHWSDESKYGEMSGYRRQAALSKVVADASGEERNYTESNLMETYVKTVYNARGLWCGYSYLHATVAANVEARGDWRISVTPVMTQMKMLPDTVQKMLDVIRYLYRDAGMGDQIPEFVRRGRRLLAEVEGHDVEGADDDEVYRLLNNGPNDDDERTGGRRRRRRLSSQDHWRFPTADIDICPGKVTADFVQSFVAQGRDPNDLDVTAEMTAFLFRYKVDFSDPDLENFVRQNIYWTSPYSAGLREGSSESSRGKFWEAVFKHTLANDQCDTTWTTKLQWRADLAPPPAMSRLSLTYDRGDVGDADDWCIMSLVAAISSHTGVCSVGIRPDVQPDNYKASMLVQSGVPYRRPWFDGGLDGSGQIVAVSDTGVDMNNCYVADADGVKPTEQRDSTRRKIVEYHTFADDLDNEDGHGTHVATTVVGRLDSNDDVKVHEADGVARGAKLAFLDMGYPDGRLMTPGASRIMSTGRKFLPSADSPMAHIHSASWGASEITNGYTGQSSQFDDYMYWNDDFLIIAAAGNDGNRDYDDHMNSVSSPSTFKNGITVGASNTYDGGGDKLGPTYLAPFSSRGPTKDGRRKPDVVAAGNSIQSAKVDLGSSGGEQCHSSTTEKEGTSMSTPVVAGTAALIRQYFDEGWYPGGRKGSGESISPSGAMVKAILLNGAQTDMNGVDNGLATTLIQRKISPVKAYDNNIGFGRIDLSYSLYLEGFSEVGAEIWDRQFVNDGETSTFDVTIDRSKGCTFQDLSATLVWVEAASLGDCTRCVQNDLDLHITKTGDDGGTKYYPNGLDGKDDINNVERVVVPSVPSGQSYTLHVRAANLNGPRQKFALVATGCFGGVANSIDKSADVFNTDDSGSKLSRTAIIVIACCSAVAAVLVGCCVWSCCRKRRRAKAREGKEGKADHVESEHSA